MISFVGTFLVFILTLIFGYFWQKQNFWKHKGIPTPSFYPVIGHTFALWAFSRWEKIDKFYKSFKSFGMCGTYMFWRPELIITDPMLCRLILVKDSDHFIDRREIKLNSEKEKVYSQMLTVVKGEKWKALRSVMTPTFTSGKIKSMFSLIASKADELVKECEDQMVQSSYVEMTSILSYYSMDIIGSCAFGIDAMCLKNKENSRFIVSAKYLTSISFKKLIVIIIFVISPQLFEKLGLDFEDEHKTFFVKAVKETVELRKKSGNKRGDFLDILLETAEESDSQSDKAKYPMTMDTIAAESILFLLGGFDTTSKALSFMVYLLAKNQSAQTRLRNQLQEIIETDGQLNYQNVVESKYLDACLSETLRLYSPAHFLERLCTKDYKFPDRDVEISKGMVVTIPVYSFHRDSEYWEDPDSFCPERFLPENKDKIKPFTYMPFGLGPRNCIAMRFAQLEIKIAVAKLILAYKMELRPGFKEMVLGGELFQTLRPNKDGVQVVLQKLANFNSSR